MISRDFAVEQMARFGCLHWPPETPAAMEELVDALMEASRSEAHAKATVRQCVTHAVDRRWPTPGGIREVAWSLLSEEEQQAAPNCDRCGGSGYLHVVRGGQHVDYTCTTPGEFFGQTHTVVRGGFSAVVECECRKVSA